LSKEKNKTRENWVSFCILDSTKENYTAELQFTPDGKYLLVSNRGDKNLVIFNINEDDNDNEVLSVKEHLDCRGSFTSYFTFDPTGQFLLVANKKSNSLVCFSYDHDHGTYTFVSQLDNIQGPVHIVFLS
jgi:6-phosphogluconolactonase